MFNPYESGDLIKYCGLVFSKDTSNPKVGDGKSQFVYTELDHPITEGEDYFFSMNNLDLNSTYYWRAFLCSQYPDGAYFFYSDDVDTYETEDEIRLKLTQLYYDTDGPNWTHNDNWCSNKPVTEWYGVNRNFGEDHSVLISLSLNDNGLKGTIDLKECDFLAYINVITSVNSISSNLITRIDVSGCKRLTTVYAENCGINELNVHGCDRLETLDCSNNNLKELDISGLAQLGTLDCGNYLSGEYDNSISQLDLQSCVNLVSFVCKGNPISKLDLSKCSSLRGISAGSRQYLVEEIDLTCSHARYHSIDICANTIKCDFADVDYSLGELRRLEIYTPQKGAARMPKLHFKRKDLWVLDVSGIYTPSLEIDDGANALYSAPWIEHSVIDELRLSNIGHQHTEIHDVDSKIISVENVNASNFYIWDTCTDVLSLSNNYADWGGGGCAITDCIINDGDIRNTDTGLWISFERVNSSLQIINCPYLEELVCRPGSLSSLCIEQCPKVQKIFCSENNLSTFMFSGIASLEELYCSDNKLTSIDITNLPSLKRLNCSKNPITQMITEEDKLQYFEYDKRYDYYYETVNYNLQVNWRYNKSDHTGWYYPGEPERGYHLQNEDY